MNKHGKFYPNGVIYQKREDGVSFHPYRGTAASILNQEEVSILEDILAPLYSEDMPDHLGEQVEDLQEQITAMIKSGEDRICALHSVLGAYDMDEAGNISKPDSERIDWSRHEKLGEPSLILVKKSDDKKIE